MTLPQAKRLIARQAGKVSLQSLEKVFLDRRVNPRLVETVLLNNTNEKVLDKVRDYFVKRLVAGDKYALNILLRASDEGINKNAESRVRVVNSLRNLAKKGEFKVLTGLLRALKDSNTGIRWLAISGLKHLAQKGELGALPGLLEAVNGLDMIPKQYAISGLKSLAKLRNKQAQKKLIQLKETW